jgi:hypothetical protein
VPDDRRQTAVFFPIQNLHVPCSWPVGRVMFRPGDWVREHVDRWLANDDAEGRAGFGEVRDIAANVSACAEVRTTLDLALEPRAGVLPLRDRVTDALAVLRLFSDVVARVGPSDSQTFGWSRDMAAAMETNFAVSDNRVYHVSTGWHGAAFPHEFDAGDPAVYRADPRFRFLGQLISAKRITPFQLRLLTALRTYNAATLPQSEQTRVILLATALEAVLGDDKVYDRAHRIARRSAYFTCVPPGTTSHAARRSKCFYMRSANSDVVAALRELRHEAGLGTYCTAYEGIRSLFHHRNDAVHRGQARFDGKATVVHRLMTRDAILATAEWLAARPRAAFHDIDQGIADLPPEVGAAAGGVHPA